jgi:hypothetical protein
LLESFINTKTSLFACNNITNDSQQQHYKAYITSFHLVGALRENCVCYNLSDVIKKCLINYN